MEMIGVIVMGIVVIALSVRLLQQIELKAKNIEMISRTSEDVLKWLKREVGDERTD